MLLVGCTSPKAQMSSRFGTPSSRRRPAGPRKKAAMFVWTSGRLQSTELPKASSSEPTFFASLTLRNPKPPPHHRPPPPANPSPPAAAASFEFVSASTSTSSTSAAPAFAPPPPPPCSLLLARSSLLAPLCSFSLLTSYLVCFFVLVCPALKKEKDNRESKHAQRRQSTQDCCYLPLVPIALRHSPFQPSSPLPPRSNWLVCLL